MMKRILIVLAVPVLALATLAGTFVVGAKRPPPARQLLAHSEAERLLLEAARAGDEEIAAGLLKAGVSPEARDARGYTPLILATYHGHLTASRALLAAGADACAGDARGNTALMGAAFRGHREIVKLLLAEPCNIEQRNGVGQTALMFAALVGNLDILGDLMKGGAREDTRDRQGRTARDWARTQGVTWQNGVAQPPPES